jgi:transcriptional regulator with XRE-family HTH domain
VARSAAEAVKRDSQALFGTLLRAHRLGALLTQEQLGERSGISPRTIREHARSAESRGSYIGG